MWGNSRLNGKEAEMQQDPSRPRGFRVRWRHVLIGMIVPAVLVPVAIADTGTPVPLPCAGQLPSQLPNPIPCPAGAGGGSTTTLAGQNGSRKPARKQAGKKCSTSVKQHSKRTRKMRPKKNQRHKHSHAKQHKRGQAKKHKRC
jgi:hypothetical protein